MRNRFTIFFGAVILLISAGSPVCAQRTRDPLKWADSIMDYLRVHKDLDNDRALTLADSAFQIYAASGQRCGQVRARILSGGYLDSMGQVDSSLSHLLFAQRGFDASCDSLLLLELYVNLSSTYLSLEDFAKTDSMCEAGLCIPARNAEQERMILGLINNKAIGLASSGRLEESLDQFDRLLDRASKAGDTITVERCLTNMGAIQIALGNEQKALSFFNRALVTLEARNEYETTVSLKINIAGILKNQGEYDRAIDILQEVEQMAKQRSDLQMRTEAKRSLTEVYTSKGDFKSAVEQYEEYIGLRDSLLNEERIRSVSEMQEKYETEKKQREIQQLKVENLDAQLETEKARRVRNTMYGSAGLLLLGLSVLYGRYRIMRRNRNLLVEKNILIETEKLRSDLLLKNILPDEVAEELKEHGHAKARHYETVSVLFSDFKGFTYVAEQLTPEELVAELDDCFQAFDEIVSARGIEKIKTIGDAYMAVGGLPDPQSYNPVEVLLAALEMQEFMKSRKTIREAQGLPAFDMRIGIHCGPVVAGVVGLKKFQFDVWGDTVNTAARMESIGSPGEVNISDAAYALVKDHPEFEFIPRGQITAKNKGEMAMYFVRRAPH